MAGRLRLRAPSVTVRLCEQRDLELFEPLGGTHHAQYCREQFARGPGAVAILVAADDDDEPVGKVHLDFDERAHEEAAVLLAAGVAVGLRSRRMRKELSC